MAARPISATLLRLDRPIRSLTLAFWLWKAVVFVAAVACPGPGYDTSTTLMPIEHIDWSLSFPWPLKFARWDAIYFLPIAERGYVFEQEWAFSYPRVLGWVVSGIYRIGGRGGPETTAMVGVILSHITHYLSVLALYLLSVNIFGLSTTKQKLVCFLSAALHIICPGGAFLSAPYGESIFSFLNISGFYLYSSSLIAEKKGCSTSRDLCVLGSALLFAIATTVRSNGILSGFLFAYDALFLSWTIMTKGPSIQAIRRLLVIGLSGATVALGTLIPQAVAFNEYCLAEGDLRPWCTWVLPSIYTWVQGFYWNVGFLRYWTISNLPLFLLAAPVLTIMELSSVWALRTSLSFQLESGEQSPSPLNPGSMLIRLAVPQGLLAVLALTSYHVQIVNRISSGYPVWYWFIAFSAMDSLQDHSKGHRYLSLAAQAMAGYALIQAVLFGSFLPPA